MRDRSSADLADAFSLRIVMSLMSLHQSLPGDATSSMDSTRTARSTLSASLGGSPASEHSLCCQGVTWLSGCA